MSSNTPNINLYKKDAATDGNDTFNITTMLNDNWDKIDTKFGQQDKDFIRQPAFLNAMSTNNVYTATSTPEPTAYVDGMGIVLKADKDSTGAVTLNWNGLGIKALKDAQGNNISLKANGIYTFKYNADMGYFILQGSNVYANGQVQTSLNADKLDGKDASDFAPSGYGLGGTCPNITGQDLNNIINTGFYVGSSLTNAPNADWYYVEVQCHVESGWVVQTLKTYGGQPSNPSAGEIYIRNKIDTTWNPWKKVQNENYAVTTNSANAYSATIGGLFSLTDGLQVRVKFNSASTGATTLNINSLGAKSIVDYFGNAVTNIRQNLIVNLCYESTSGNFILQGKGGGGNATSADLLSGKTATVDGGQITGSMPSHSWGTMANNTAVWSDNGNTKLAYRIPLGAYLDNQNGDKINTEINAIENNLNSDNIKAGKTIFGVSGKSSVVDTSDATATASQIRSNQIAYVNGSKVVGTLPIQATGAQTVTPGTSDIVKSAGIYDGDITIKGDSNLKPENILKDVPIFGVVGSATIESLGGKRYTSGTIVSDASGNIVKGNLPFTPSRVLLSANFVSTGSVIILFKENKGGTGQNYSYGAVLNINSDSNMVNIPYSCIIVNGFSVDRGMPSTTYNYEAWE